VFFSVVPGLVPGIGDLCKAVVDAGIGGEISLSPWRTGKFNQLSWVKARRLKA
jgi:hypothetical protein